MCSLIYNKPFLVPPTWNLVKHDDQKLNIFVPGNPARYLVKRPHSICIIDVSTGVLAGYWQLI